MNVKLTEIKNNVTAWLKIPADGSPLTFTGNADEAAKEFFNALIRVRDGYISALNAERDAQQKRADALAVENQALSAALSLISGSYGLSPHIQSMCAVDTPTTDAALAAIEARAKVEAIEQLAIQLEQLPDEALEFLSDAAEFETYQEEHHSFVSISNPRAVANAVLSLVKEQSTDPREAK
ncbi:hypothetical protein [Serratia marcescens]|uniref:hypothetical protein n=1 Tax=Serratia marcescens TaxID=615 RepID=UPI004045DC97